MFKLVSSGCTLSVCPSAIATRSLLLLYFLQFVFAAVLALAAAKPSPPGLVYTAPAIAPFAHPLAPAPIAYSPLTYAAAAAPYKPAVATYSYNFPYAYNYGYNFRAPAPYAAYPSYIAA